MHLHNMHALIVALQLVLTAPAASDEEVKKLQEQTQEVWCAVLAVNIILNEVFIPLLCDDIQTPTVDLNNSRSTVDIR